MAQFTFDAQPPDPHRSTKSRVRRDDQSAAGVGNAGPLKRGTEVVERRDGEDLSTSRKARWPRASAVFDLGGMSVQAPGRPSFSASASPSIVTDWALTSLPPRARVSAQVLRPPAEAGAKPPTSWRDEVVDPNIVAPRGRAYGEPTSAEFRHGPVSMSPQVRGTPVAARGHPAHLLAQLNGVRVRLHVGPAASASCEAHSTEAMSIGPDILLALDHYDATNAHHAELLTHELDHVLVHLATGDDRTVDKWSAGDHREMTRSAALRLILVHPMRAKVLEMVEERSDYPDRFLETFLPQFTRSTPQGLTAAAKFALLNKVFGLPAGEGPLHGEGFDYARPARDYPGAFPYVNPRAPWEGGVSGNPVLKRLLGGMLAPGQTVTSAELNRATQSAFVVLAVDEARRMNSRLGKEGIHAADPEHVIEILRGWSGMERMVTWLGIALHIAQDRGAHGEGYAGQGHDRPGFDPDDKRQNDTGYFWGIEESERVLSTFAGRVRTMPRIYSVLFEALEKRSLPDPWRPPSMRR